MYEEQIAHGHRFTFQDPEGENWVYSVLYDAEMHCEAKEVEIAIDCLFAVARQREKETGKRVDRFTAKLQELGNYKEVYVYVAKTFAYMSLNKDTRDKVARGSDHTLKPLQTSKTKDKHYWN